MTTNNYSYGSVVFLICSLSKRIWSDLWQFASTKNRRIVLPLCFWDVSSHFVIRDVHATTNNAYASDQTYWIALSFSCFCSNFVSSVPATRDNGWPPGKHSVVRLLKYSFHLREMVDSATPRPYKTIARIAHQSNVTWVFSSFSAASTEWEARENAKETNPESDASVVFIRASTFGCTLAALAYPGWLLSWQFTSSTGMSGVAWATSGFCSTRLFLVAKSCLGMMHHIMSLEWNDWQWILNNWTTCEWETCFLNHDLLISPLLSYLEI